MLEIGWKRRHLMRLAMTVLALLIVGAITASAGEPDRSSSDFFEARVRPILVEHCYACHSSQARKLKGGLLLDTVEGMRKGGQSGPAVVPGKLDDSLLIEAVRYNDESTRMPPKGKLPGPAISALEQWIKGGAPGPSASAPARHHPDPPRSREALNLPRLASTGPISRSRATTRPRSRIKAGRARPSTASSWPGWSPAA